MRTTALSISIASAIFVAVACGGKKPAPAAPEQEAATTEVAPPDEAAAPDEGAGTQLALEEGKNGSSTPDTAVAEAKEPEPPPEVVDTFKQMSLEDQKKFMKEKVVPAMAKAFKEFDKKEFAKFGCKTCHGKGVASGKYEMPNPDLPKLDFAKLQAGEDHPKTAEFMEKVVKPQMAEILGLPEYTPDNPKGFGCLHCHTMKE